MKKVQHLEMCYKILESTISLTYCTMKMTTSVRYISRLPHYRVSNYINFIFAKHDHPFWVLIKIVDYILSLVTV